MSSTDSSSFISPSSSVPYDALLLVSFGGPEGPDDIAPFLENVVRGKNVPPDRLREVAQRYDLFGGVSPANARTRALLAALVAELNAHGPNLPVYWGNRNWHPLLPDVVQQMADDGIRHALAFVTSAFGSYSGCRQYREDIQQAREAVGVDAPQIDKIRLFLQSSGLHRSDGRSGLGRFRADSRRATPFGPVDLHRTQPSRHDVAEQSLMKGNFARRVGLVAERLHRESWQLAYQSRSGPPTQGVA